MSGYMREIKEPYFNVNGTEPAMTKVTVEQAIELLRQHDTLVQDKGREFYISIDNEQAESIADLLESLSRDAEIGMAAVDIFEDEMYPCTECRRDGYNEKCLESCEWIRFCRLRVVKEGGE